jgi:Cys-tRNA(Pro)/Cys-tRNA(Cys) deacylase
MVSLKEVQPLTGYIRGGVTVFGARKAFPVFVDETAILFDRISVSAGTRGTQLILSPDDYLRAAAALEVPVQTADLTKESKMGAPGPESGTWDRTGDRTGRRRDEGPEDQ